MWEKDLRKVKSRQKLVKIFYKDVTENKYHMEDFNPVLLILKMDINDLNIPMKRLILSNLIVMEHPILCYLYGKK